MPLQLHLSRWRGRWRRWQRPRYRWCIPCSTGAGRGWWGTACGGGGRGAGGCEGRVEGPEQRAVILERLLAWSACWPAAQAGCCGPPFLALVDQSKRQSAHTAQGQLCPCTWESTSWMQPKMMINCCRVMPLFSSNDWFRACTQGGGGDRGAGGRCQGTTQTRGIPQRPFLHLTHASRANPAATAHLHGNARKDAERDVIA